MLFTQHSISKYYFIKLYLRDANHSVLIIYSLNFKMEGTNEQIDNLTGQKTLSLQTVDDSHRQKQKKKRNYLKTIAVGLATCAIILSIITITKYYTIQECQHNLEAAIITEINSSKQKNQQKINDQHLATEKYESNIQSKPTPQSDAAMLIKESTTPLVNPAKLQNQKRLAQPQYKLNKSAQNLWFLPIQEKISLLSKIKQQSNLEQLTFTPILRSKDEQIDGFFAQFQNRSEVVDWVNIEITKEMDERIVAGIKSQLEERRLSMNNLITKYQNRFKAQSGYMPDANKGITYQQFIQTLQLKRLTGSQIFKENNNQLEQIQRQQRQRYENKYQISQYQQLPICIVMPTYNNKQDLRYIWSLQSLLQQEYGNFKVIIIDDNSKDKTAESSAIYLKWRKADPQKYILISAKQHRSALQNIYYGVHRYCDYNQIFIIFDGDDELFGRQALKVINSQYQKEKYYIVYSQFISYNPLARREILQVGISEDFPYFVKRDNSYRTFKHSYSQLRSMISDIILLVPVSSLKLKDGRFFELLYDNALFYPAFEMSCRNFIYLPQIFYWYNINTGANDWNMAKTQFYKENRFGIQLQKPFRCIQDQLKEAKTMT